MGNEYGQYSGESGRVGNEYLPYSLPVFANILVTRICESKALLERGYSPGTPEGISPRSGRNQFQIPRVRPGVSPGYSAIPWVQNAPWGWGIILTVTLYLYDKGNEGVDVLTIDRSIDRSIDVVTGFHRFDAAVIGRQVEPKNS